MSEDELEKSDKSDNECVTPSPETVEESEESEDELEKSDKSDNAMNPSDNECDTPSPETVEESE